MSSECPRCGSTELERTHFGPEGDGRNLERTCNECGKKFVLRNSHSQVPRISTEKREELAALEHRQWMHWTKWLVNESDHDIPEELEEKWKKNWKPYSELPEDEKDKDRKWANKAVKIIEED